MLNFTSNTYLSGYTVYWTGSWNEQAVTYATANSTMYLFIGGTRYTLDVNYSFYSISYGIFDGNWLFLSGTSPVNIQYNLINYDLRINTGNITLSLSINLQTKLMHFADNGFIYYSSYTIGNNSLI